MLGNSQTKECVAGLSPLDTYTFKCTDPLKFFLTKSLFMYLSVAAAILAAFIGSSTSI